MIKVAKNLIIVSFLVLYGNFIFSQVDHLDKFNSLKSSISQASSDQKIDLLSETAFHGGKLHVDSALTYLYLALPLLQETPTHPRMPIVLNQLSECYLLLCQYSKADSFAQAALKQSPPGTAGRAHSYRSLSAIAAQAPDAEKAVYYADLSISLFDSLAMPSEAFRSLLIKLPMLIDHSTTEAIDQILWVLEKTDSLRDFDLHHTYLFELAKLNHYYSNHQEASRITETCIDYFGKTNNLYMLAVQYYLQGILAPHDTLRNPYQTMEYAANNFGVLKNYYRQALTYMRMSISDIDQGEGKRFENLMLARELSEKHNMEIPQLALFTSWHLRKSDLDSAIALATETYERASLWGQKRHAYQAAKNLGDFYYHKGDFKQAFIFRKIYDKIKNASVAPEGNVLVGRLEAKIAGEKLLAEQKLVAEKQAELQKAELAQEKFVRNIFMAGGGILLILIILTGLGYRKVQKSNQVIESQKLGLERLDQLNRKIFSVIAHDFKGPLISLSMLAEQIDKNDLSLAEMKTSAGELHWELRQCNIMLENLLNWAKAELKIRTTETLQARPRHICEEVVYGMHSQAAKKQVQVDIQIPKEKIEAIHPDILRIVFRNLLSNAIKFSHPNEKVTVGYSQLENGYFVKDKGVGIPSEIYSQLFTNSVLPELGTQYESGFGMGLYITNELLRKSGWKLKFESKVDQGSTFLFYQLTD